MPLGKQHRARHVAGVQALLLEKKLRHFGGEGMSKWSDGWGPCDLANVLSAQGRLQCVPPYLLAYKELTE